MAAVLLLYLAITLLILKSYSDAWDNVSMFQYGRQSASIISHPFQHHYEYEYGPADLRYFGPFLVTTAFFTDKLFGDLLPFWSSLDIFRLVYFITYLAGVWFFYKLAKRYLTPWIAFAATLLFISQPLFFGQALTSPKDTTFLGITIMGVYFGLRMIDECPVAANPVLPRKKAIRLAVLAGLFAVFLLIYQYVVAASLHMAAGADETSWLGQLFRRIATEYPAVPIEQYISKLSTITLRAGLVLFSLAAIVILGWKFFHNLLKSFKGKYVILAGVLFGLGISVRILGLLVGGIVLLILIFSRPIKDWFYLIAAYSITAGITIYLTWPYLWPKPIDRFLEALQVNLGHQHNPNVWFNGASYLSSSLPRVYVPTLIGVQFTLPLILLAGIGLFLTIRWFKEVDKQFIILILVWLILPIGLFMVLRPAMHDNIRHSLFITPPLFLLAGLALERISQRFSKKNLFLGIMTVLALLPGAYHIIKAHPYEYIYFNELVGGTKNGAALFEVDYLALSLSEGVEYINQNAEPSATVYVVGPENIARSVIREDLNLISRNNFPDAPLDTPDTYLVTYAPQNTEDLVPLYQVNLNGVLLGGVYKHPDSE